MYGWPSLPLMVLSFLVTMVATKGFSLVPPTTVSFSSCCSCFCFSVLFLRSFLSFTFAFSFSLSFLSLFFPLPCPFSCHDPYQPSADTVASVSPTSLQFPLVASQETYFRQVLTVCSRTRCVLSSRPAVAVQSATTNHQITTRC